MFDFVEFLSESLMFDFENDLWSWHWGLNLKFGADVQCRLLKLSYDVDYESNVWGWCLKLTDWLKILMPLATPANHLRWMSELP